MSQVTNFVWATGGGGGSIDLIYAVAVDNSGNTYVAGSYQGSATFGGTTLISAGADDIFVAKLNPAGNYLWARSAGGVGYDAGYGIATDGTSVYITGIYNATATFATTNITAIGAADAFMAKYDVNGNFQWVTSMGGPAADQGEWIAIAASGAVNVTGQFGDTATFGVATQLVSAGSFDVFIAQFASNGTLQWAQRGGGAGAETGWGIAVDASGNIFIDGPFTSVATFGTTSLTSSGGNDVFVAKLDSAGNFLWAAQGNGTGDDTGTAIVVDDSGNVYITGYFQNSITFDGNTLNSAGQYDVFVVKYNTSGTIQWARSGGGAGDDAAYGIATDGTTVFAGGTFNGTATFGGKNVVSVGSSDIFVAQYSASGDVLLVGQAGGADFDIATYIAADRSGSVYFGGYFQGTSVFGTNNLVTTGSFDSFAARLSVALVPALEIIQSGANAIVSWTTNSTGFALQFNTEIGASWTLYGGPIFVVDGKFTVTNAMVGTRFYRLRKP